MGAYLNGKFLDLADAQVSVLDRGFLFGDGVYEVMPVYSGRLFHTDKHLARLARSLDAIRIRNPHSDTQWADILEQLIAPEGNNDLAIYLQVTRGVAPRDHAFPKDAEPTVFAMCNPMKSKLAPVLENGISTVVREDFRWGRCDIKSVSLLGNVLLQQDAVDASVETTILVRNGYATEAAASNLFIVSDGAVITPPKSNELLGGISRDIVIELAHANGIALREERIPQAKLHTASEIWLTGTTWEVVPVTTLDEKPVGDGKPGPEWARMYELFQQEKAG